MSYNESVQSEQYIYSGVEIKTIFFTTLRFTYVYDHQVNTKELKISLFT